MFYVEYTVGGSEDDEGSLTDPFFDRNIMNPAFPHFCADGLCDFYEPIIRMTKKLFLTKALGQLGLGGLIRTQVKVIELVKD